MENGRLTRIHLPGTQPLPAPSGTKEDSWGFLAAELSGTFLGTPLKIPIEMLCVGGLSDFALSVLRETARIPPGDTLTYRDVARRVGRSEAVRAVGQALARNPFPLVFPCHRVVSVKGLGGYQGGLEMKDFLLATERKTCTFQENVLL